MPQNMHWNFFTRPPWPVRGERCGWLLWMSVVGGCCGWVLWVSVVGGCCGGGCCVVIEEGCKRVENDCTEESGCIGGSFRRGWWWWGI